MCGKDETALPQEKVKADSVGDAMLSVDDVCKSRDCCELERKKISKESDGSVYGTENEADGSTGAVRSTSKTMAAADAKEQEELVPVTFSPVKMDTFTFQWVTWRREVDIHRF